MRYASEEDVLAGNGAESLMQQAFKIGKSSGA